MRKISELKTWIRLVAILAVPIFLLAPSAATKNSLQTTEKVKLITSTGIENFVKDLNDNGNLGYRLEKSLNFGGEGPTQSYAAIVRLDAPNKYEYDWMSSPDKKLLEGRLNFQAKKGFNFVNAYALTNCSSGSEEQANQSTTETLILRLQKGDAFLLERKHGATEQTREYKVFIAKVRLGDSAEKTIQAGLDAAGPQGFRPVKILFTRQGLLDFSVSVLAEKGMTNSQPIESRFLKKTSGLPKDMNALAAQGFRFITGRRIGMIGLALMQKRAGDAATYNFIETKKYAKEFDKTIAQSNSYQALMLGDLTCGSSEPENERLVFTQNSGSEKREYKIKTIAFNKNGAVDPESLNEFQRLLGDGYQVKDLFYAGGLNLIFEK
jgi:hypothetical protein